MTLTQFCWFAASYVLGAILLALLLVLIIAVQWLDFQDKQAAKAVPAGPVYRARKLKREVHYAEG